jgi:hypothetical protein
VGALNRAGFNGTGLYGKFILAADTTYSDAPATWYQSAFFFSWQGVSNLWPNRWVYNPATNLDGHHSVDIGNTANAGVGIVSWDWYGAFWRAWGGTDSAGTLNVDSWGPVP